MDIPGCYFPVTNSINKVTPAYIVPTGKKPGFLPTSHGRIVYVVVSTGVPLDLPLGGFFNITAECGYEEITRDCGYFFSFFIARLFWVVAFGEVFLELP